MPRRDAIDVSRHNGPIDWATVAQHIGTAATKATQGTGWVDPTFATNRAGMAAAGLQRRFLYHWLSPKDSAAAQADHYLRTVSKLAKGEGVLLDVEEAGVTAELAAEWCEYVEARTGRPVTIYTGVYTARSSIWPNQRLFNGTRGRWLAAYTYEDRARKLAAPYGWDAWQWTSSGNIPGVADQTIDLNQIDRTELLDASCGLNAPIPTPEQDDDMPTIYRFSDADAYLVTVPDPRAAGIVVQSSGPGSDPKVIPWLHKMQALGVKVHTITVADCAGLIFAGSPAALTPAAMVGDSRHTWTGDEFKATLPKLSA
jgi:GH25 family lysozyme M1 (1,4-beta-N-acetylmuramidase)